MVRKNFVHKCQLQTESNNEILTNLWSCCLISKNENYRKILRLSQYGIEMERKRNLISYRNVIHPFSIFRFYWEFSMVLIFLLQILLIPHFVHTTGDKNEFVIVLHIHLIIDLVCLFDILLNFKTGIFDEVQQHIILEKKVFIRQYCFTFFFPDLISSIPFEYICHIIYNELTYSVRFIIVCCKFLHIFRIISYLNRLRLKRQWPLHIYKICETIIYYILLFTCCTSLLGIARAYDPKIPMNRNFDLLDYNSIVSSTANMIFGLDASTFLFFWGELLVHIFGRIFGTILFILFLAQVVSYFLNRNQTRFRFIVEQKEMQRFLELDRMPRHLKDKVNLYNTYVYGGRYYNEKAIWCHLSDEMKNRALHDILEPILNTDIFALCPLELRYMIVSKLHKRKFVPDMVIQKAGTLNVSMDIIQSGSVRLLTESGEEVAIIYEGKVFHDVLPINNDERFRKYTIIANDFCIVYKLLYRRLEELSEHFPDVQNKINEVLAKKTDIILQNTTKLDLDAYYKL